MQNTQRSILILVKLTLLFVVGLLSSCRYNQHLQEGQLLLNKNEIKIVDTTAGVIKSKGDLIAGMHILARQKPNTHLIGVRLLPRVKLWKYNSRYKFYSEHPEHEKIRERKVEAPVLINELLVRNSDSSLKQFMINNGYYYSEVSDTVIPKHNQEAKVIYTVTPGKQYYVKKVSYDIDDYRMKSIVVSTKSKAMVRKGRPFRNIDMGSERERLFKLLRNQGYYTIKTENIQVVIDTIDRSGLKDAFENPLGFSGDYKEAVNSKDSVAVEISIVETRDSTFDVQFTMDRIYVKFKDPYNVPPSTVMKEEMYNDILFQYHELPVQRKIIYDNIFIHKDDIYSTKSIEATYNRLNQLGTFQFVDIQFEKSTRADEKLDCYIELTLAQKRDISANVDISAGEDYLLGFGGGVNFGTKNLLKGGNKLTLQSQYSIETRARNRDRVWDGLLLSANNFSSSVNLTLPRFLIPFRWNTSRNNTPFTILSLSHSRVNRVNSFKLVNTTAKISYSWKETVNKNWLVSPMFLSLTSVPKDKLSEAFRERIQDSRYLLNTYSTNFIMGENINYEYRSDLTGNAPKAHTLSLGFEEAGLLMQGINGIYKALSADSITNIAHYMRADIDYRFYYTKRKYQWASRAMVGVGVPTFGDISLPYIKQYSQGGAFSNRGWQLRNLGPGRTLPDTSNGLQLVDRTGDMKLELNTEVRFALAEIGPFTIKGATFIDAGNIWLFNEDSTNVGGEIRLNKLWQDIAISSGVGLRLDFSFFVFRIDHAWRFKYPYKPENNGWDIRGVRLNDGQWNVAIGYPF